MTDPGVFLDRIQALLDAATPGPWLIREPRTAAYPDAIYAEHEPYNIVSSGYEGDGGVEEVPDADLIAAAPQALAAMVGALRAVLALCDEAKLAEPIPVLGGYIVSSHRMVSRAALVAAVGAALTGDGDDI